MSSPRADREAGHTIDSYLDEQEEESFPASDPHSDWSGPPARRPESESPVGSEKPDRVVTDPGGSQSLA